MRGALEILLGVAVFIFIAAVEIALSLGVVYLAVKVALKAGA